jgi:DnaK suppressor protein
MRNIDFNEFETSLLKMKAEIESNIARLREELEYIATDDSVNDMEDLASLESESLHHTSLLEQQQHELDEVNHALSKIKDGTYGICEKEGKEIPIERLRAEPHTRFCIEHAQ